MTSHCILRIDCFLQAWGDAASNWSMVRKNHSTNQVLRTYFPMISSIMRYRMYKCISQPVLFRFARFFKDDFPATVATIDSVQHAQTSQSKISISFASRVEPAKKQPLQPLQPSQPFATPPGCGIPNPPPGKLGQGIGVLTMCYGPAS